MMPAHGDGLAGRGSMRRNMTIAVAVTAMMLGASAPGVAETRYKLNRQQTEAIELSNLSPEGMCVPGELSGRVIAVQYNRQKTLPLDFTVEMAGGDRVVVNVDTHAFADASRLAQGWVGQGLIRMVRKGNRLRMGVKFCGAAGRVIMLDRIRRM